ncbi:hypothetical protein CSAL01_13180 [Colletotrichum salicis]|uniref:Uncharacterized protein n=1 Tax=Colletotrichum salicis TaxID=1209931 RepID=A0A135V486_9PEZI|nr:hypothetical protein CSAL01_13180 [Colletotrichum salicis]
MTVQIRAVPQPTTSQMREEHRPGNKIETVITDRPSQQYAGEPSELDVPDFTRTGSFHQGSSSHDPRERYYQASDVRRQFREAPSGLAVHRRYSKGPSKQAPYASLSSAPPYWEFPIVPSSQNGSAPKSFTHATPESGPVHAFYNEDDRTAFDFGYKDVSLAPRGARNANSKFNLATYHPAPTYVDCSTVKH